MTDGVLHFMRPEHNDLRLRLALFLRGQFPRDGAKRLAQTIDCDPRTAESILLAHWPNASCWQGIVRAFGRDVLAAVFDPEINHVVARLSAEERLLEEKLNAARARRRQVQGGDESDQDRMAEAPDEKCALTGDLFGETTTD